MAKRTLTPKQIAAGFGGKAAQRGRRQRKARKSTVAKRSVRSRLASAKSSRIGQRVHTNELAWGAGAGALATYAPAVAGDFGPGLALAAVGVAANDSTLQTMGGVSLGAAGARALGGAAGIASPGSARFI